MMYRIEFRPVAWRELEKLEKRMSGADYEALEAAIDSLANEPRPRGCRKVTDTAYLRIKVAPAYRVIYQVEDVERKVTIIRVAKRAGPTYKHLP